MVDIADEIRVVVSALQSEFMRRKGIEERRISFIEECRFVHDFVVSHWTALSLHARIQAIDVEDIGSKTSGSSDTDSEYRTQVTSVAEAEVCFSIFSSSSSILCVSFCFYHSKVLMFSAVPPFSLSEVLFPFPQVFALL